MLSPARNPVFSVSCIADPPYTGDGKATFLDGPPLGIDGYEIEFPEMKVVPGSAYEFSVSTERFQQVLHAAGQEQRGRNGESALTVPILAWLIQQSAE